MTRGAEYPSPIQFITFAVLATAIALIAFWVLGTLFALTEIGIANVFPSLLSMLLLTLMLGWPIWGPILLCALFPGCVVFVIVRRVSNNLPIGRRGPTIVASAAVAVFSWGAVSVLFWAFALASQPFQNAFLLIFGVPAAMIAAGVALPNPE